jgi:hypothetical protein
MARWLDGIGTLWDAPFDGDWTDRVHHNVPGPVFAVGGQGLEAGAPATATLACGPDGRTFVWRQPRDAAELEDAQALMFAGWLIGGEVGLFGDRHWTLDGIRAWWAQRALHAAIYRDANVPGVGQYFERELPDYLRAYAFFLVEGRRPIAGDPLPDIDAAPVISLGPPVGDLDDALQLVLETDRRLTARGCIPGQLPFWGQLRGVDVPGPFWGGKATTRVPGVAGGIVYRQPASSRELEQLLEAAVSQPASFGIAPKPWTAVEVRSYWVNKRETLRSTLKAAGVSGVDAYIDGELADYLRRYLYVLERARIPQPGGELPELVPVHFRDAGLVFREPPELPFTRGVIADELSTGGRFEERNPLNVPGMFYGASTDTCGTGPGEAPANVALDDNGQEFVFRQPRDLEELKQVFNACWAECFDGFGTDGNEHWTVELVRAWWAQRENHRVAWRELGIENVDQLFDVELPKYLRGYVFFLEHRRMPNPADKLPGL